MRWLWIVGGSVFMLFLLGLVVPAIASTAFMLGGFHVTWTQILFVVLVFLGSRV